MPCVAMRVLGGNGEVKSAGIANIQLQNLALGYVAHPVDCSGRSVVNMNLPGQHALDDGWIVLGVQNNYFWLIHVYA